MVARHGRAALRVLPDPDLAEEQTLTPEHITRFARRVAAEIRSQTRAAQPVPAAPAATRTVPPAAAEIVQTAATEQAARRAAIDAAHAAMMGSHAPTSPPPARNLPAARVRVPRRCR
jgi:hypothetical protein